MPKGEWRLIVAFVAVLGLALGAIAVSLTYAQHEHEQAVAASQQREAHQKRPQQGDTNHAGVPGFAQNYISNPEPRTATERENRDLAAQENTAAWAFWMTIFTGAQFLLSALGLWALLETIKQGRAALGESRKANLLSREISDRENRPWLDVDVRVTPDAIATWEGTHVVIPFDFSAKHFGNSPALDVEVIGTAVLGQNMIEPVIAHYKHRATGVRRFFPRAIFPREDSPHMTIAVNFQSEEFGVAYTDINPFFIAGAWYSSPSGESRYVSIRVYRLRSRTGRIDQSRFPLSTNDFELEISRQHGGYFS
jgi:hypothetical protein